ncbi:MAG TPA: hypothetical protein DCK93_22055 [Blastocatellia bacterium]|nr:hypothetical protein [Blastocatellia bacterium]
MQIEKIFIATHKHDVRLTRICVASIRYWYPDIPIYLIKDYYNGDFSTEEIERVWNVGRYETPYRCFGWGMSKLEPVFSEQGTRILILDSDTVFDGKVLDRLEPFSEDFVVHLEDQSRQRVGEIYFDLEKLNQFDPHFNFLGQVFNTGQYVATGGLLRREDFDAVSWTTTPPSLRYPEIFKNGDQGVLNYVLLKKAASREVTLAAVPFMRWPQDGIRDINLAKLVTDSPYSDIIHWAGLGRQRVAAMIRSDILLFFEAYYYSKIRLGKTRNLLRTSSAYLAETSIKVLRKVNNLRRNHGQNNRQGSTQLAAAKSPGNASAIHTR